MSRTMTRNQVKKLFGANNIINQTNPNSNISNSGVIPGININGVSKRSQRAVAGLNQVSKAVSQAVNNINNTEAPKKKGESRIRLKFKKLKAKTKKSLYNINQKLAEAREAVRGIRPQVFNALRKVNPDEDPEVWRERTRALVSDKGSAIYKAMLQKSKAGTYEYLAKGAVPTYYDTVVKSWGKKNADGTRSRRLKLHQWCEKRGNFYKNGIPNDDPYGSQKYSTCLHSVSAPGDKMTNRQLRARLKGLGLYRWGGHTYQTIDALKKSKMMSNGERRTVMRNARRINRMRVLMAKLRSSAKPGYDFINNDSIIFSN